MATQVQTPVGRLVWGHPAKTKPKTDQRTRQPILKDGKPVEQWAFGIAYSKADFANGIWPAMSAEIRNGYPSGPPNVFAYKFKDGDTNDRAGKPYSTREGYAGNVVLTVSTEAYAPPVYKIGPNGQYVQLQPHEIKTGDYVVLVANLVVNVPPTGSTNTPSIYINPVAILHVGYGMEIMNVVDPTTLFGATPQFQLPPGASLIPLAPPNMPGMPGTMPALPGPGYPQPPQGYAPPPDPRFTGAPQPPNYAPPAGPPQGYPPQGYAPPAPPNYAPPAAPPAYDFVRNAGGQYAMPPAPPQGYPPQPPQGYAPPVGAPPAGPGQMPGYTPPAPPQGYPPPAAPPNYAPPQGYPPPAAPGPGQPYPPR